MDCPKCGYERQPADTHCTLCGLDFKFHENQQAEKKALKQRTKNVSEGDTAEDAPLTVVPETVEEGMSKGKCPKCGVDRKPGAKDCINCGVVFEKHEDLSLLKEAEKKDKKEKEAKRLLEEKARIQREAKKAIKKEQTKRQKESAKKSQTDVKTVSPSKGKLGKIVAIALISALVIAGGGFLIKNQVVVWKAESARKEELARQKEIERKRAEAQKKIVDNFYANQPAILKKLRTYVDQRKYTLFEKELKKYDIASLESDLDEIKAYYKEIRLLRKAKRLPGSQYEANYKIYAKLAKLNPSKRFYKKKEAYYKAKYNEKRAEDKYREARNYFKLKKPYQADLKSALSAINEAIKLGKKKKIYKNLRYKLIKAKLHFFEGNNRVEMAVRDEGIIKRGSLGGQRRLYVWIKNVWSEPFYVNVDFFTLVDTKGRKYGYNTCSKGLVKSIKPGEQASGYLYFYTTAKPRKLVFSHINAGTIYRKFP